MFCPTWEDNSLERRVEENISDNDMRERERYSGQIRNLKSRTTGEGGHGGTDRHFSILFCIFGSILSPSLSLSIKKKKRN